MEWSYDSQARCWRLNVGGWEARVARWPASFKYTAEVTAPAPGRRVTQASHVFPGLDSAQAWCIQTIARAPRE
jgi:hypothetical protein